MGTVSLKYIDQTISDRKHILTLISNLFTGLNSLGFSYCHWKSNEHLDASFTGDTDLDILFDHTEKDKLEKFLEEAGFRKFVAVSQKRYRDIEDYIGLDTPSGKIVHLHAHYRLTMGEPYLKGYQLSIQQQILDTRVFDPQFGMYRTFPPMELILLFFRQALKLRHRDKLKIILNKKTWVADNLIKEYRWLINQSSPDQINELTKIYFTEGRKISEIINGPFSQNQFYRLSIVLKKELKKERLFNSLTALAIRWYREAFLKINRKLAKHTKWPIIQQRVSPGRGLVIAVIGADGSGKSTVIKNLTNTFNKKLDVYPIYYGNGSYTTWANKVLNFLRKRRTVTSVQKTTTGTSTPKNRKTSVIKNMLKILDAQEIANVKNSNLKRMLIARSKGIMVICDRYPQNQVMGYNDGPRLSHLLNSKNWLFRIIARRERQIFLKFEHEAPDIVFKLIADAKTIESRKPGQTPLHILEDKIKAIRNQQFPGSCTVVTVDSSKSPDKVLYTIKKKIWESL